MSGSVNKVILVGNLGRDPEVRNTQDGRKIVNPLEIHMNSDDNSGFPLSATNDDAGGDDARGLCIAVLDRGFVYVGRCIIRRGWMHIEDARCVRRWGTTHGLGELATNGTGPMTKLEAAADVAAPLTSVMHLITCRPEAWA